MANLALMNHIAGEVETLLANYPTAQQRFREQLRIFNDAWKKYWKAKDEEPQITDKQPDKNTEGAYEYDADFKLWFPKDEAKRPPDPTKWELDDKLPCYYGPLAVIYDSDKGTIAPYRLCEGVLDNFLFAWMQRLLLSTSVYDKDKLETALKWVKLDIQSIAEVKAEGDLVGSKSIGKTVTGQEIINEVHKHIPFFREQWGQLCQMVEDYGEAQQPYSARLKELGTQIDKAKGEEARRLAGKRLTDICPPPKDYVQMMHTDEMFVNLQGDRIFRPAEPVNPLLWFDLVGNPAIQRDPTDEEEFIRDCTILSIYHDFQNIQVLGWSEEHIFRKDDYAGKYFERDDFCWALWEKVKNDEARIDRAFNHVKPHLPGVSETPRSISPTPIPFPIPVPISAKKRKKATKKTTADKTTAKKGQETVYAEARLHEVLHELAKFTKGRDMQPAQEIAGDVAGELLRNQSCRARFQKSCQSFHNGYRARYEDEYEATAQDRELFQLITEGGASMDDEQSLVRDYVLLAGVHDWMLWRSYVPIYTLVWPEFLTYGAGLILVALEDEQALFKAAYSCVKNDLKMRGLLADKPVADSGGGTPEGRAVTITNSEVSEADWNDFLDDKAKEVDGLVLKYSKVMPEFRKQIRPFAERWEEHRSGLAERKRKRLEHWEKVKQNPAWQDMEAGPPKEGWEWDKWYLFKVDINTGPPYEMPAKYGSDLIAAIREYLERNYSSIQEMAMLGMYTSTFRSLEYQHLQGTIAEQEMSVAEIQDQLDELDPKQRDTEWIRTPPLLEKRPPGNYVQVKWWVYFGLAEEAVFGCWHPPVEVITKNPLENLIPKERDGERKLPELKNRAEEDERYYVTLTSIHDNRLSVYKTKIADESIWPQELAEDVWFRFTDARPYGPDKTFIKQALEHVKHDLKDKGLLGEKDRERTEVAIQGQANMNPNQGTLQERAVRVNNLVYGSENSENIVTFFRDQDREWYRRYKEDEKLACAALPPRKHSDNKNLARIQYVFGMPEDPQPSHKLVAAARYVGLTILHDTFLPDSERINDGIWNEDDEWVRWFQDSLKDEEKMIPEIDSDLACVEAEIRAKVKQTEKPDTKTISNDSTPHGNKDEANVIRQIADKLSIWHESGPGDKEDLRGWCIENLPERGRKAALESLKLLQRHIDLLHRCSRSYGDNSECRSALRHIDEYILVGMRTNHRPLESFIGDGEYLALPGFMQELRRWADELGRREQETPPDKGAHPQWSTPMNLTRSSKVFGRHRNTMRRWFKEQIIRNKKVSARLYRVDISELPAEVVAKIRAIETQK